jgi:hypothetical protein
MAEPVGINSGNPITFQSYLLSNVLYAKITDANTRLAKSFNGGTDVDVIEDIIAPPSLATGKISTTLGSATVVGTETKFEDDFKKDEFLYYYSVDGEANLLGQIYSVDGDSAITLYDETISVVSNKNAGSCQIKLKGSEDFYIRIPVVARATNNTGVVTTGILPNLQEWRMVGNSSNPLSLNNSDASNLRRYSNPGDVTSVDTTSTTEEKNVVFTIEPMNIFSNGSVANTVFGSGTIPNYIWFKINPYGNDGVDLVQSTMYKLYTRIPFTRGAVCGFNTRKSDLVGIGYINNYTS